MQVEILQEANDALCAGDLNFVAAFDKIGVPHWAPTKPSSEQPIFREWQQMQEDGYNNLSVAGKTISAILRHKANSKEDLMAVCPNTIACVNTVPNIPTPRCCSELHSELVAALSKT